jgi:hypothetical protein
MVKRTKVLPENTPAPTCQTCHMQGGNHEVRTAWGFLAIRKQALRPDLCVILETGDHRPFRIVSITHEEGEYAIRREERTHRRVKR